MTSTMKHEPLSEQDRTAAASSGLAPLYAVAGLTEVVTRRVGDLTRRSLPDLVRAVPEFTTAQLTRLGEYADSRRAKAGAAYAELAGRGKVGVDGVLGQAVGSIDPVLERLQQGMTRLRHTVTVRTSAEADSDEPTKPESDSN